MAVAIADREIELENREVRVVGCLIEKELSTPDYYPMTINALASACNQKTNRDPVVEYSESDVVDALESLQRKRLVGSASSSYGRAGKYRHALAEVMGMKEPQLAVLASLMLRGPETAGEVRARTARMHAFESLEAVDAVLENLAKGDVPLVAQLPRRPGQKEARYIHLFAAGSGDAPGHVAAFAAPASSSAVDGRIEALEQDVASLRTTVSELAEAFRAFKKEFE